MGITPFNKIYFLFTAPHGFSINVPLCEGVDPLSSRSFTETTPVSINIFSWARSPLYAATCAGKARSEETQARKYQ